jgi:ATP synthase protein I
LADDRAPDSLDARIAAARAGRSRGGGRGPAPAKGYGQGARVLAELIGAPLGGGLVGWLLDRWLGTAPWLMLVLLVLAVIVAFRNIYRISQEHAQ